VFLPQKPWHDRGMIGRVLLVPLLVSIVVPALAAPQVNDRKRYGDCLAQADLNAPVAFAAATKWVEQGGGPPAQHCAAVALVSMKRYAEGATRLDALGHAPGLGDLRAQIFDQAGNAWILAGNTGKAIVSFQAALTLSANDADLYADLARAQAMQDDWPEVESDLNAALAIQPRRADLLVLRASARSAQNRFIEARSDIEAALRLSPKNPEAIMERGSIKRDSGDLKGARADFQAALTMNPSAATREEAQRNIAALDIAAQPKPKPVQKK
jgi:tetratricopeptide (TPR) repeat protein